MNKEDYVALVNQYVSDTISYDNWKISLLVDRALLYYDKTGKLPVDFEEPDVFDFFLNLDSSKAYKYRTIVKMYGILCDFYNYLLQHGVIKMLPVENVRSSEFAKRIVNEFPVAIPYYKRADILHLLNSIELNKTLYTTYVLSFYEGVVSDYSELLDLKFSDFDYDSKSITMARGVKHVSNMLADAYEEMKTTDIFISRHPGSMKGYREFALNAPTAGGIAKVGCKSSDRNTCKVYLSKMIKGLREYTGEQIDRFILYNEGFLEYICGEIGEEATSELLRNGRKNAEEVAEISKYIDNYKFNIPSYKACEALQPYVIALKRRYKKFIDS